MQGDIVQSKRKPPVLVPLREPLKQSKDRLKQRLQLLVNYAERYRELDDIEAREYLNLKHIIETGTERPKAMGPVKRVYTFEEQCKAISAVLD
jgi:hypothetical protein